MRSMLEPLSTSPHLDNSLFHSDALHLRDEALFDGLIGIYKQR